MLYQKGKTQINTYEPDSIKQISKVDQAIHTLCITSYGKTQANILANPIEELQAILWQILFLIISCIKLQAKNSVSQNLV